MKTGASRRRGRAWWVSFAVIAVVGGLLAAGWWAAGVFVSPEQRDADATPPSPVPVTARVESGHLVETATAQGTVVPAVTKSVVLSVGDCDVLTAETLAPGAAVTAGTVLTEVCGRPVVGMPGDFKYYRDLWPGMTGPDVTQLQAGLAAAGFPVKIDGDFGVNTSEGLRALYRKIGYNVPTGVVPDSGTPKVAPAEGQESPVASAPRTEVFAPASEFASLPSVEMVSMQPLPIGTVIVSDTTIDLVSGGLVIRVNATEMGSAAVAKGVLAEVAAGDLVVHAIVTGVADEDTGDGTKRMLFLDPVEGNFAPEWVNSLVVVTFVLRDAGEHQLVVPSTAIDFTSDGHAFVLRQAGDGVFEPIRVEETATVAGRSAVRPVAGELNVDDLVAVR